MDISTSKVRNVVVSLIAITGVAACAAPEPRSTVRESERVIRNADEVCRERVVTEQRRERDGDRTRVATSETTCRER